MYEPQSIDSGKVGGEVQCVPQQRMGKSHKPVTSSECCILWTAWALD